MNSSGGMTSGYECSVNVAVFQCTCSFAEGQVLNFHIFISQAISSHNLTSICFSTGTSSTYSDAFAFEVIDGINTGFFQGYDLHGFRIQSCQALETSYLFAFEHFLTISSIESDIVLDESNINFALVQQVNVSYGSTSGLCRCVAARDVFVEDIS